MSVELLHRVAESRVAEVYLGQLDGEPVAVKRLKAGYLDDPALTARLERESDVASRIRHPNLTRLLRVERDRHGRVCLVSQWVDGVDLDAVLAARPRSVELAIYLCTQVLYGLDHLHGLDIVHRDIAPQNILVSRRGDVQITDFGIARHDGDSGTSEQLWHGTLGYISLEQLDRGDVDRRSDLFSAGALLYELLTGVAPFGKGRGYLGRVSRGLPSPPSAHNPDVGERLDRVVCALLSHRPADRFQTARELLEALPACPNGPAELEQLLAEILPAPGEHRAVRARSHPVIAGLALGVAAAIGLWWAIDAGDGEAAEASDHVETTEVGKPAAAHLEPTEAIAPAAAHLEPTEAIAPRMPAQPAHTTPRDNVAVGHRGQPAIVRGTRPTAPRASRASKPVLGTAHSAPTGPASQASPASRQHTKTREDPWTPRGPWIDTRINGGKP